jgi:hypothetical protein
MTAITEAREEQVPSRINRDEPVIFTRTRSRMFRLKARCASLTGLLRLVAHNKNSPDRHCTFSSPPFETTRNPRKRRTQAVAAKLLIWSSGRVGVRAGDRNWVMRSSEPAPVRRMYFKLQ